MDPGQPRADDLAVRLKWPGRATEEPAGTGKAATTEGPGSETPEQPPDAGDDTFARPRVEAQPQPEAPTTIDFAVIAARLGTIQQTLAGLTRLETAVADLERSLAALPERMRLVLDGYAERVDRALAEQARTTGAAFEREAGRQAEQTEAALGAQAERIEATLAAQAERIEATLAAQAQRAQAALAELPRHEPPAPEAIAAAVSEVVAEAVAALPRTEPDTPNAIAEAVAQAVAEALQPRLEETFDRYRAAEAAERSELTNQMEQISSRVDTLRKRIALRAKTDPVLDEGAVARIADAVAKRLEPEFGAELERALAARPADRAWRKQGR